MTRLNLHKQLAELKVVVADRVQSQATAQKAQKEAQRRAKWDAFNAGWHDGGKSCNVQMWLLMVRFEADGGVLDAGKEERIAALVEYYVGEDKPVDLKVVRDRHYNKLPLLDETERDTAIKVYGLIAEVRYKTSASWAVYDDGDDEHWDIDVPPVDWKACDHIDFDEWLYQQALHFNRMHYTTSHPGIPIEFAGRQERVVPAVIRNQWSIGYKEGQLAAELEEGTKEKLAVAKEANAEKYREKCIESEQIKEYNRRIKL